MIANVDEGNPLPKLEHRSNRLCVLANDETGLTLIQRECNYLQALKGDIDTSHFGFLHAGHIDPDDVAEDEPIRHAITSRASECRVAFTAPGARNTQPACRRPG
jgi:phthalate 4,5-dioxygenase